MNKRSLTQGEREECVPTDDELEAYLATPDDKVARKLREKLTPELFGKFALVILYSENIEKAQDAKTLKEVGEWYEGYLRSFGVLDDMIKQNTAITALKQGKMPE